MSTPNFALKNASRYFVLGMPVYYTQEEIDERKLDLDLLGMMNWTQRLIMKPTRKMWPVS